MRNKSLLNIILLILLLTGLHSCQWFTPNESKDGEVVAKVYDKHLYESELKGVIPSDASKEDSAFIARNYIKTWIKEELELHKAELNLTGEQKDFEKQLEKYRKSLILYKYEKEIIKQNLDTTVTEEKIEAYYLENQKNFELRENIVKAVFVQVNKNAPKIDELREWYKSTDESEIQELKEYCLQFSSRFNLGTEWVSFEKVINRMPLKVENQLQFLQNKPSVERKDSMNYYFLSIREFKSQDSISPLSFERENIRNIILNQRKLELINKMKQDMYETALKKNKIEIYR